MVTLGLLDIVPGRWMKYKFTLVEATRGKLPTPASVTGQRLLGVQLEVSLRPVATSRHRAAVLVAELVYTLPGTVWTFFSN